MMADNSGKSNTFEEALSRLSEIVKELDGKDTKLEESMNLFEEGVKLSKYCREVLQTAAKKVDSLDTENDSEE